VRDDVGAGFGNVTALTCRQAAWAARIESAPRRVGAGTCVLPRLDLARFGLTSPSPATVRQPRRVNEVLATVTRRRSQDKGRDPTARVAPPRPPPQVRRRRLLPDCPAPAAGAAAGAAPCRPIAGPVRPGMERPESIVGHAESGTPTFAVNASGTVRTGALFSSRGLLVPAPGHRFRCSPRRRPCSPRRDARVSVTQGDVSVQVSCP
jgi:hypothetical protein